ncbi:hypothetical protein N8737_02740 [Verrucomicrobia bacterium]|jgi:hypothetical protein|nr:hypothetical protein [Verrucomicrobiota bacterium]MDA7657599.1 hypothetical protein [Verrucomicrobiota bacterium]
MGKGEISWKGHFEDGRKRQVYAKHMSKQWSFYERERRFDPWEEIPHPSLEDWLSLLDGVERRVHRRLVPINEIQRLHQRIKDRYPDHEFPR